MLKKLFLLAVLAAAGYWLYIHGFGWKDMNASVENGSTTAGVLAKIAREDPLLLLSVKVSSHHGDVILQGRVPTPEIRNQVAGLARSVKGVSRVYDGLVVAQTLRTPAQIKEDLKMTAAVKEKLIQEEGVSGLNVHVEARRGMVILTGTVPTMEHSLLARRLAAGIHGVNSVQDKLVVTPSQELK